MLIRPDFGFGLQSLYDFIDIGRGVKPGTYRLVNSHPKSFAKAISHPVLICNDCTGEAIPKACF